eukprot:898529-Alexandrium_andersonii.AAC.1
MALSRHCGPWTYMPPLLHVSGVPDVQEALVKALNKAVDCIQATQYTFDARCLAHELTCAARRGVDVQLLIDKSKCLDPPGLRQVDQLELLLQWGVEVRPWPFWLKSTRRKDRVSI